MVEELHRDSHGSEDVDKMTTKWMLGERRIRVRCCCWRVFATGEGLRWRGMACHRKSRQKEVGGELATRSKAERESGARE